jgi:hypothetical protein
VFINFIIFLSASIGKFEVASILLNFKLNKLKVFIISFCINLIIKVLKESLNNMKNNTIPSILEKFSESVKFSLPFLKENGHYIVFVKDLQPKEKKPNLLHSSLIEEMNKIDGINYVGMKIWADESINLYPYGYPYSFVSNQLHQYIMFFKKKTV